MNDHDQRTRIEDDLQISHAISAEGKVQLNLMRTYDHVTRRSAALFKSHGLSEPQYNVLRILRGAQPGGLPCQLIGERMIARVPDITRLLDRLEGADLVGRSRSDDDRRVVLTRIKPKGMDLLAALDEPLLEIQKTQYSRFTRDELLELSRLLEKVRYEGE